MNHSHRTCMRQEIDDIPSAARRLTEPQAQHSLKRIANTLRQLDPLAVVTIARGSSDHAASCVKYAIEITAHIPVASIGSSIASIYHTPLRVEKIAAIGISQSGRSSDLIQMMHSAMAGGGHGVIISNTADSPLANAVSDVVDICAGPEHAVALRTTGYPTR